MYTTYIILENWETLGSFFKGSKEEAKEVKERIVASCLKNEMKVIDSGIKKI